ADAGDGERIEAAGEDQDAGGEGPARVFTDGRDSRHERCDQHAETVDEVVEDGFIPDVQRVGVELVAEAVRAESAESDGEGEEDRGDRGPVHKAEFENTEFKNTECAGGLGRDRVSGMRGLILLWMAANFFGQSAKDLEAVVTTDLGTFRFEFAADKAPKHV